MQDDREALNRVYRPPGPQSLSARALRHMQELREGRALEVFCDGACWPNPGPGAFAFAAFYNFEEVHSFSDGRPETTNNAMELLGMIHAVRWVRQNVGRFETKGVTPIFCDNQYVVKGVNSWSKAWKKRGWRTKDGRPIANKDMWIFLSGEIAAASVSLQWVKGHAGIEGNERADALSTQALKDQMTRTMTAEHAARALEQMDRRTRQ